MSFSSFLVAFLGFSMYSIMSSADSEFNFFSSLFSVISSSSLIVVARTSKTVLNKGGGSGHPYLAPDLRGNTFGFSQLSMMLAAGLLYMGFIMLRYVPCITTFWRAFIINSC